MDWYWRGNKPFSEPMMTCARPTNAISIELRLDYEFDPNSWSTDHNEIVDSSQQYYCRDACKIL